MKPTPMLHYDAENSYFYHLILSLIPLILYGWYKNGILPFLAQDVSWFQMFRPLFFPILGFLIGLLWDYGKNKRKKISLSLSSIYGLILSMTLSINMNLLLVCLLEGLCFFLFSMLEKLPWKVNTLLGTKFIFVLGFSIIVKIPFSNIMESTNPIFYSLIDLFFGRNIGGVASTSILLMLCSYAFLSFDYYYKKRIPLYTFFSFTITALIAELIIPTGDLLKFLLNPSVLFASIFLASEITSSPYTEKGGCFYGLLIGFTSFFSTRFFSQEEGIYLTLFLVSLLVPLMDNIGYQIEKKNQKFCRMPKTKNWFKKEETNLKLVLPKIKKHEI